MSLITIVLALIVLVNGAFALCFVRDAMQNRDKLLSEPASSLVLAPVSFVLFLLSTFGISDFAIASSFYPKLKWVSDKKLPGTLNTECVIPVAVMALCYISSIDVDKTTLVTAILCQVVGAYISPRFVVKLPAQIIKRFVALGLFIAAAIILASKFGYYPTGGDRLGLEGQELGIFAFLCFLYGALNNIGIGSYPLTMATVYAMGLSPVAAFPIMMGACTFSVPIGAMQFVKLDQYSRKITLFTSTFGVLGVLAAVFVVKSMNMDLLQWLAVVVILYSAVTMFLSSWNQQKEA